MSIRKNVVANVAGKIWSSLMSFAFVPFYIRLLGIEAYGLIGFFVSLLAMFFVLDMGLSTSITRELARLTSRQDTTTQVRSLVRTLEVIYWSTGLVIGTIIFVLAPWLARDWLHLMQLSAQDATQAIRLMGLVAALRWPVPLYTGGLMGLQRQVLLNLATAGMATVQGGGGVLVLLFIAPTVQVFFLWQVVAAAIQAVVLASLLWRLSPSADHRPRFAAAALRSIWLFSAGVTGITIVSVVLTQLDKFLVSKLLPLETFGYYSLAGSIAGMLNLAAMALYGALFPAFSQLIAAGRIDELRALYHKSCQLLSVVLFPIGVTVMLFSRELLSFYVRDPLVVEHTHALLSLLVLGNMFLSVMLLPLALQLGYGWTSLSLYKNVVAVVLFVPLLYFMIVRHGVIGAAIVWIVLTLGYVLIEIPLMHRRILPDAQWRWYFIDIGAPLAISAVVIGVTRLLVSPRSSLLLALPSIGVALCVATLLTIVALPATREWAREVLLRRAAV